MAFTTEHEVTRTQTVYGVEFRSSGVHFATIQDSDGKLALAPITNPADVAACGLTLDANGKVVIV